MSHCAYIFLDEAGNFDFSTSGSRYFVLTSVSMHRPFPALQPIDTYKHDCIESGPDIEYFHCYRDNREVRNHVFDLIASHLDLIHIDYLVAEKRKASPILQESTRFYPEMLSNLLKLVLPMELDAGAEKVIVITDMIPVNKKRRIIEKAVWITLAKVLPPGMKYRVLHHQSRSHYGLQVADYCCWAIFRKWQRGEKIWYDRINSAVRSELDIFRPETEC